jgi:hypothetical protein
MHKHLLLLGLLSLPLLGTAQTSEPTPRFYVGAGAALLTGQPFHRYATTRIGPALTVGYQLRPRLALQLSGAYTSRKGSTGYDSYSTDNAGNQYIDSYSTEYRDRLFTLPVLLRGELTNSGKRLHVDALVGATLLLSTSYSRSTSTYQGQTSFYNYDYGPSLNASLSLGPALRYSLTPRLEATADVLVNIVVTRAYYYSFNDHLFSNVLAGVRYRFGQ